MYTVSGPLKKSEPKIQEIWLLDFLTAVVY